MKLAPADWSLVVNMAQVIIIEAPLVRWERINEGNCRSLFEVITGLNPGRLSLRRFPTSAEDIAPENLERVRAEQLINFEEMQKTLENFHEQAAERSTKRSQQARAERNKRTMFSDPVLSSAVWLWLSGPRTKITKDIASG